MLFLVDEKFTEIKNAKDVQDFLRVVDVSDRHVGQTYVDSTIENDVPEAMVEMLNNGWRNSIKPDCQVSALKYLTAPPKYAWNILRKMRGTGRLPP